MLDYRYHSPTTHFPLLVPECFLLEPTETEAKDELDGFVEARTATWKEAKSDDELMEGSGRLSGLAACNAGRIAPCSSPCG